MVCKIGIWDDSIPGIKYNENGVSNYAIIQQKLMQDFPRGETGSLEWENIVKRIKSERSGKSYDCIVGISGGTDSSYLLYVLKQANLNPLAVNLDNGWNSEIAVDNIKIMTSALGIDLETYVIDYEEIKDLMRCYIKAGLPWIDAPTDNAIQAVLYIIANKLKVSTIFVGNDFRSEGKQPTEWTYSDPRQLKYLHKVYGSVPLRTYPMISIAQLLFFGFLKKIKVYPVFNFIEYNKQEAQALLREQFGWRYYGEHHHENLFTKFAIGYWMYEKFGIDKRKITYSAQVLNGAISREEALKKVSIPPYSESELQQDLDFILNKLSLSKTEFKSIWDKSNKSFLDYPSYYKLFHAFYKFAWPVLSKVVPTKPKIFYEMDEREKSSFKNC